MNSAKDMAKENLSENISPNKTVEGFLLDLFWCLYRCYIVLNNF
jgi:CDP-diglyceride synthetase